MSRGELIADILSKVKSCENEIIRNDEWDIFNKGRIDAYKDILRVLNETK